MAEIRWTLTPAEDLRLLEDWIARDSLLNAVEFTDRLVGSAEKLAETPLIGRVVPEFRQDRLRELIFRGYRIVYSTRDGRGAYRPPTLENVHTHPRVGSKG